MKNNRIFGRLRSHQPMKRAPFQMLTALALAMFSPDALAMGCQEVLNMLQVGVTSNIVAISMRNSGTQFTSADVACLSSGGAPAVVVETARSMQAQEAPPPAPVPVAAPAAAPRSAIDADDDILGGRVADPRELSDGSPSGPTSADPALVTEAVQLIKAKKPLSGTLRIYDALRSGNFPDSEVKLKYYMARGLEQLEMYHTAQHFFLEVVNQGPSSNYFKYALPKLVKISRITGDETDLLRVAPRIPPEAFPRRAKNQMYYLMGLRKMKKDDLTAALKYFGQVSSKSSLYLRARYLEGVIYNKQGKLKSAVRSFRDVYRHPIEGRKSARAMKRYQALKDLALINVARIYYKIERFEDSTKYYDLVAHDSAYWPEALFNGAWAHFMQNNLNEALGHLLTTQSPFFSQEDFIPEVQYLKALTYFNLCEYKDVERLLLQFEDRMRPIQMELKEFVKGYASAENRKMADKAWDAYMGLGARGTQLPKSLFTRMLRNRDLAGVVDHMALMEDEVGLVQQQKPQWRDTVGVMLQQIIEKDRQKYKRRAGLFMLSEMARWANTLQDLLTSSEIVRFEVIDAQRVDYQYKFQNANVADLSNKVDLDFATAKTFIYWPFNGEFWKDELGYYHYTEQGSCQ
jgi:tetratricopeptide (TPR) repeat protein